MKVAARAPLALLLVAGLSRAATTGGRFGFGVTNIGSALPASLSVDWRATQASALELALGIDTQDDRNLLLFGGRYFRHVFIEERATFSTFLGGGLLTHQVTGESHSGYYLELGAGTRFYLPDLPNLGLGVHGSLGIQSAGSVRFLTGALFSAHYYF